MAKSDISHVFVGAAQVTGGSLGGLFRQKVGDDRWERLTKGLPEPATIQAVTIHPSNPQIVFVGTHDGPYRSDDGGDDLQAPRLPARPGRVVDHRTPEQAAGDLCGHLPGRRLPQRGRRRHLDSGSPRPCSRTS